MIKYHNYYNLAKSTGIDIIKYCTKLHNLCIENNSFVLDKCTLDNGMRTEIKENEFTIRRSHSFFDNSLSQFRYESGFSHSWGNKIDNGIFVLKNFIGRNGIIFYPEKKFNIYVPRSCTNIDYSYVENTIFGDELLFQLELIHDENTINLISFWKGLQENITLSHPVTFSSIDSIVLNDFKKIITKNLINLKINMRKK